MEFWPLIFPTLPILWPACSMTLSPDYTVDAHTLFVIRNLRRFAIYRPPK